MGSPAVATTFEDFARQIGAVTGKITGRLLDHSLEEDLNRLFPAQGNDYETILRSYEAGIGAGWMYNREAGGIKYGRVLKQGTVTHDFNFRPASP